MILNNNFFFFIFISISIFQFTGCGIAKKSEIDSITIPIPPFNSESKIISGYHYSNSESRTTFKKISNDDVVFDTSYKEVNKNDHFFNISLRLPTTPHKNIKGNDGVVRAIGLSISLKNFSIIYHQSNRFYFFNKYYTGIGSGIGSSLHFKYSENGRVPPVGMGGDYDYAKSRPIFGIPLYISFRQGILMSNYLNIFLDGQVKSIITEYNAPNFFEINGQLSIEKIAKIINIQLGYNSTYLNSPKYIGAIYLSFGK